MCNDRSTLLQPHARAGNSGASLTTSPPAGQFLLLYGRRRLGKTYLLQHFFQADSKPHAYYLADQTTASTQRLALAESLLAALPDEGVNLGDLAVSWNAILRFISQKCQGRSERFGLILDEFPYLVARRAFGRG